MMHGTHSSWERKNSLESAQNVVQLESTTNQQLIWLEAYLQSSDPQSFVGYFLHCFTPCVIREHTPCDE